MGSEYPMTMLLLIIAQQSLRKSHAGSEVQDESSFKAVYVSRSIYISLIISLRIQNEFDVYGVVHPRTSNFHFAA